MTSRRPEPSRTAPRVGPIALSIALILVAGLQTGCAEKLHRRARTPFSTTPAPADNQGAAWDVVFPGPASAGAQPAYELARRDDHLNRRDPISPAYQDAFASERLPTLDARSYLYLTRSQNRFIYFSRPPKPVRWLEP